jgi:EmrB/QacA subfamily drug resistance transporter
MTREEKPSLTPEESLRITREKGWTGGRNPWTVALVVTMATFMEVLDTAIANVSLPHIAGNLSASIDESTWVLTSYLVSNAVVLPISGWIATRIGRKRFYMTCVALFTISSFLCGLAPNLGLLVFFRVLQGIGGGGLGPSEQAILADTFPPAKRGMAFAVYGMAVVMAPAIGPTLGGFITDHYSWRWVFFINVPVGIASLLLSSRVLVDPPHLVQAKKRAGPVDTVGLGLIAVGLGALEYVLDKGQEEDWFNSHTIAIFATVAAVALVSFVVWEWRQKHPVVEVRLFRDRNFAIANLMMLVMGMTLYGSTVLLPQYLQVWLGYSAQEAGMVLSPGGVTVILLLPLVGRLISKVDARYLIAFGFLVLSAALLHMAHTVSWDRFSHGRADARVPELRARLPVRSHQLHRLQRRAAGEEQPGLGNREPRPQHGRRHRDRGGDHAGRAAVAVPPGTPGGTRGPFRSAGGADRGHGPASPASGHRRGASDEDGLRDDLRGGHQAGTDARVPRRARPPGDRRGTHGAGGAADAQGASGCRARGALRWHRVVRVTLGAPCTRAARSRRRRRRRPRCA